MKRKKGRFDLSLWVSVTAIAVLVVILFIMAVAQFQRQQKKATEIFVEKGATLIRSFEAGLHDVADKQNRVFYIQKLLMATAQQPDIDYLIVTDAQGNIIADSDPSMISQKYGLDLNTAQIAQSKEISWRQTANPEGADTFEVYRGLFPLYYDRMDGKDETQKRQDKLVIYVGFNMSKIEKAAAQDRRITIIRIFILLLIGSSAIVSLFLVQAYRLTRTTLSRMKVFSDTLIKNMPIGLIAVNDERKIVSCNERAQKILTAFCSNVRDGESMENLPEPLKNVLGELSDKGELQERDVEVTTPQGEQRKWETVTTSLIDEDVPAGKILLIRDVTEIRELEREVAKSRHLTSISSLAAGVAHEIRNPLSSIKGFAVYLKDKLSEDSEDKKTADIIIEEVERLNRVITQLIEFARPLEIKTKKTRISDLIGHTIKLVEAQADENNINIRVNIADNEPYVEVDQDKTKQVLLNIFLNALAAMKEGGRLEITLEVEKENVRLVVSDTGKGIAEMDLPRIYDPYFTSKPAGTGLGLAVVQKIMEAHGGKISVESVAGKGTKVFLYFPV